MAKAAANRSATTAVNLHDRLTIMKNKMQSKKAKPSERTLKKRQMKKLKKDKELKKKVTGIVKSMKNEKVKEKKYLADNKDNVKKAVYNEDGKLVFSKFEFGAQPANAKKTKKRKLGAVFFSGRTVLMQFSVSRARKESKANSEDHQTATKTEERTD